MTGTQVPAERYILLCVSVHSINAHLRAKVAQFIYNFADSCHYHLFRNVMNEVDLGVNW